LQVLEPPSQISIDGDYARGFLFSTKRTLPAPEGDFQINRQAGHDIAQTFRGTHFMIDGQLLEQKDDGHFYGHGLEALLKGYEKKSHGLIEKIYGPFYYPDNSGDYWYEFGMKLRNSGAAAALQEYGARTWEPFAVSPHLWDYPELGQDPYNLKKARGVGVALVMRGAFGNQAIINRFCKGSSDICYSDKGLGAVLKQECRAGCSCEICKNEDAYLAKIISSHLGKTGTSTSNILDQPPNTSNSPENLGNKLLDPKIPPIEGQIALTEAKSKEALALELEEFKRKAKEEAEKEWKDKVTALENKDKLRTLNEIYSIVTDENARKVIIDKHKDHDLNIIEAIKAAIDDYKPHLETSVRSKLKAETEKPDNDNNDKPEGDVPPSGNEPTSEAKNTKKGKAGSELPPEPKHPMPKEEINAPDSGKAGSGTVNRLARLRTGLMGAVTY